VLLVSLGSYQAEVLTSLERIGHADLYDMRVMRPFCNTVSGAVHWIEVTLPCSTSTLSALRPKCRANIQWQETWTSWRPGGKAKNESPHPHL